MYGNARPTSSLHLTHGETLDVPHLGACPRLRASRWRVAGPLASSAFAQLIPPAGSAGAGSSAISGIPAGPANPSVLSDPSGIGNAGTNGAARHQRAGAADVLWLGHFVAVTPSRSRVVTPSYTSEVTAVQCPKRRARKPSNRRRGRPQTSSVYGDLPGLLRISASQAPVGIATTSCMNKDASLSLWCFY